MENVFAICLAMTVKVRAYGKVSISKFGIR